MHAEKCLAVSHLTCFVMSVENRTHLLARRGTGARKIGIESGGKTSETLFSLSPQLNYAKSAISFTAFFITVFFSQAFRRQQAR